jgi:hypothetical protein
MGFFDDIVHTVGASLAAVFPHPPPAIHAAANTMLQAMLGDPHAHAKVAELSHRNPALARLFAQAHERFTVLPAFWHRAEAYAHGVEGGWLPHPAAPPHAPMLRPSAVHGGPLHHPLASGDARARAAQEAALSAIYAHMPFGMVRTAPHVPPPRSVSGRATHSAHGGVPTFRRHSPHGSRHGSEWRGRQDHAPEHERSLWAGPWGWGADYLLDESEELADVPTPDDGEPEWGESRNASWMGD